MAAFKFKLEFLLKLRAQKEEAAKRKLAARLKQIRELEDYLEDIEQQVRAIEATIQSESRDKILSAPVYLMYKNYQDRLLTDRRKGQQFLKLSRKEEEKERAQLLAANIDHRLMVKLKEKAAFTFRFEQEKLEQENLEDLASLARGRQKREG